MTNWTIVLRKMKDNKKERAMFVSLMLMLQEETKLTTLTKLRNDIKKLSPNRNMECACST
jgi:hypothetical protein